MEKGVQSEVPLEFILCHCLEVGSDLGVKNWKLVLSQNHFKIGSKVRDKERKCSSKSVAHFFTKKREGHNFGTKNPF